MSEVVGSYCSKKVCRVRFWQLKDPQIVGLSQMFHWTQPKIWVQVFYCLCTLAVTHGTLGKVHQGGIEEIVLLAKPGTKPDPTPTGTSPKQTSPKNAYAKSSSSTSIFPLTPRHAIHPS